VCFLTWGPGIQADPRKWVDCQTIERGAINCKVGAVAGAIPATLEGVPAQVTADMRASGRYAMQATAVVAIDGNLAQAFADDSAVSRFQLIDRIRLARRKIVGKILDCRDILGKRNFLSRKA